MLFLVGHAVMKVSNHCRKNCGSYTFWGFSCNTFYLQTCESIYCLKNRQLGVNKNWNSSMKSCQPSLLILYMLMDFQMLTDLQIEVNDHGKGGN